MTAALTTPSTGSTAAAAATAASNPAARGSDFGTRETQSNTVIYNFNGLLSVRDAEQRVIGLLDGGHRNGRRPIFVGDS